MARRKRKNKSSGRVITPTITLRRRLSIYYWRLSIFIKISLAVFVAIFIFSNIFSDTKKLIKDEFYKATISAGFELKNIVVQGQTNTPSRHIINAIGAKRGDSILSISLPTIQKTLENSPWVKSCIVERKLPDTLYIALLERKPIAIWQFNKKLYLIDEGGDRISNQKIENFPKLLHIIGEGGNLYAKTLVDDLSKNPDLAAKVHTAIRYGNRRWNIVLDEDITVKMPEENFQKAYEYLQKIHSSNKLFGNKIKTLDLRLSDRYFYEKK